MSGGVLFALGAMGAGIFIALCAICWDILRRRRKEAAKGHKLSFANIIICVCVAVALVVTGAVIYEYHRLDTPLPSGIVTALLGFWGGELMIIALRQIFGSDAVAKARAESNNNGGSI